MQAEKHYSPFTGFGAAKTDKYANANGGALGSKLQAVDWQTQKLSGQWKVFDAKAVAAAADKKRAITDAAKVAPLNDAQVQAWREENNITIFASECPAPLPSFDMLRGLLPEYIQRKFAAEGFKAPTPIQAQSWPILFAGRDIVGIAKTGSGKTLSFIVPAIAHVQAQAPLSPQEPGPICVVLAPTRELAQQTEAEARKVLPAELRCACIYGGAPKGPQLAQLQQGVHILVATPGRLIDFLEMRRVRLLRTTYVVMDEADRMLDMGFEPQVRAICSQIRPDRQMLMFSATWPIEIQKLARTFQRDFIRIHVGSTELVANADVTQRFILTQEWDKFEELKKIMAANRNRRVLVFCKTKRTADQLEYQLKRCGYDVMAIHGDKEQHQREFILERFRRDSRLCVVATDVAARGLDIKQLEVVVNFDFPMQIDDYVHRIGRTGRAGAKGESITMITKKEDQITTNVVRTLIGIIESAKQEVPEWLRAWVNEGGYKVVKRGRDGGYGGRGGPMLHYAHTNRPTFDTSSGGVTSATPSAAVSPVAPGAPRQFFGLAPKGPAAETQLPQQRTYVKFDSDDDDDGPQAKKGRPER